jgi:hypothetical protein
MPKSSVRALPHVRLLLITLASWSGCACGCPPDLQCQRLEQLGVRAVVHDQQGNVVPIAEASYALAGVSHPCDPGYGVGVTCRAPAGATVAVTVVAAGETLTADATALSLPADADNCDGQAEAPVSELTLAGEGCPAPSGDALRVSVSGIDPGDETVSVRVLLYGQTTSCVLEDGVYHCPSLSPYAATYSLYADAGGRSASRTFLVPATDCTVEPLDVPLAL